MNRLLQSLENLGNKIPNPSLMFAFLCLLAILASSVAALLNWQASWPLTGETIYAKSLLSAEGARFILGSMVENFTSFAPVGVVLVAMLGIGISEKSGLLQYFLEKLVRIAPRHLLSFTVAFAGILSNLGADAGYVVLVPLSALLFLAAGRSPLAGIATCFAGVSAGYSANLLIGPVDAMLSGISTEALALVKPEANVSVSANWYFNFASSFFIAGIIALITDFRQWPKATSDLPTSPPPAKLSSKFLLSYSLVFLALLLWASMPENGVLRDPKTQSLSPLMNSTVVLIALYFAGAGLIFGFVNKRFTKGQDVVNALEASFVSLASYMVMMFFAAQFIAYFNWSQLGTLVALNSASGLSGLALPKPLLLVAFILVTAMINIFIGSASAKWALMAPIFIPLLHLLTLEPEAVQQAYRIGDSASNIISPMMPYFALVLAFLQQHDKNAGVGTLLAAMLPYSLIILGAWSAFFAVWLGLGLPLGF